MPERCRQDGSTNRSGIEALSIYCASLRAAFRSNLGLAQLKGFAARLNQIDAGNTIGGSPYRLLEIHHLFLSEIAERHAVDAESGFP